MKDPPPAFGPGGGLSSLPPVFVGIDPMLLRMVRRGQQAKRELKRAQAEVEKTVSKVEGVYTPPPREDCVEHRWHDLIDDAGTVRVSILIWRHSGRLVDFVMLVELSDWEAWAPLSRIDCCHGFCHLHPPDREDEHEPIQRLDSVDDVETAFRTASGTIETIARTIRGTRGPDRE